MKTTKLIAIIALLSLVSCVDNESANNNEKYKPQYYSYNPDDTIDNGLYWNALRIDSAIVEFHQNNPRLTDSLNEFWGDDLRLDSVYASANEIWHEFLDICAKKNYAEALEYYNVYEHDIAVAIPHSTLKFNFDNFVMWDIVFDNLPEGEAIAKMISIFEFDKVITESVILFSTAEGGSGYIPVHYPYLLDDLYDLYQRQGNTAKTEEIIETLFEHRDFVIDYATKKGVDYDDYINTLDLISQQKK